MIPASCCFCICFVSLLWTVNLTKIAVKEFFLALYFLGVGNHAVDSWVFSPRRFLNHYDEWYSCVRSKWKESEVRELDKQSYARTACGYLDRKYLNKRTIGGERKMGMT